MLSAKLLNLLADKLSCLERLDLTAQWIGDSKAGSTSELEISRSYRSFRSLEQRFLDFCRGFVGAGKCAGQLSVDVEKSDGEGQDQTRLSHDIVHHNCHL